jgi:glycosyltransferase involved in cell wall biosynthesis
MQAQAEDGHCVGYFCAGRQYPLLRRPRLHRWSNSGVRVFEVLNSPIDVALDMGTSDPLQELDEPHTERLFRKVLGEFRPDVLHLQELFGLPSSLIDIAHEAHVPVIMTLQDYLPLCPTLKLFDTKERVCLRRDPGEQCSVCCAAAPTDSKDLRIPTLGVHLVNLGRRMPRTRDAARRAFRLASEWAPDRRSPKRPPAQDRTPPPMVEATPPRAPAAAYQQRRDRNIERLSRVDLLLAMSHRVEEIYSELGVDPKRLRTLHLTLEHLALLRPRSFDGPPRKLRFATLGGAASVQKGAAVILDAVRRLDAVGLGDNYTLAVHGLIEERFRSELERSPAVSVEGFYDPGTLNGLLESVDVGIVPSLWEEAYAYVGVEFLAKGIPVIGNARGGITDYIQPGETGWLNEDSSGSGLARLMAAAIRGPEDVWRLHGRIVARRDELIKTLDHHVSELDGIYRGVVAGSGGSRRRAA